MLRSIITKSTDWLLPTIGGASGGIAGWLETYSNTIWSAVIFAVVGGVLGFWVGKLMQWTYRCITKTKRDERFI